MKQRLLLICLVALASCVLEPTFVEEPLAVPAPAESSKPEVDPSPPNEGVVAHVTFVSDGDSLVVDIDGTEEQVRLIGINTPERDECYGSEARDALIALVNDADVLLVPDIEEFDQYGRMLSYVYFNDLLINAEMARRGTALTRSYPPNTTLQPHLTAAREYAEAGRLGLWGACTSDGDPNVVILSIQADAPGRDNENLNGEFIIIKNQTDSDIDLSSWTIRDESSVHRYVFDINSVIATGDFIVVHTGCGANAYDKHYWCNSSPVWDNSGDTAFLVDAAGNIHDRFGY